MRVLGSLSSGTEVAWAGQLSSVAKTSQMHPSRALNPAAFSTTGIWRALKPRDFFATAGRYAPWFAVLAIALAVVALYVGFALAPPAADQGEAFRIVFVHVPAAWMSLLIYIAMAAFALLGLTLKRRLSPILASALAPTGATFSFIALWSGALWGRPTWGSWWVWDARLSSELVLLFFYLGIVALQLAISEPRRADRATGILTLVGAINVPVVHFSVQWWSTLHQSTGIALNVPATSAGVAAAGTSLMALSFLAYTAAAVLVRAQNTILERERRSAWVAGLGSADALV